MKGWRNVQRLRDWSDIKRFGLQNALVNWLYG